MLPDLINALFTALEFDCFTVIMFYILACLLQLFKISKAGYTGLGSFRILCLRQTSWALSKGGENEPTNVTVTPQSLNMLWLIHFRRNLRGKKKSPRNYNLSKKISILVGITGMGVNKFFQVSWGDEGLGSRTRMMTPIWQEQNYWRAMSYGVLDLLIYECTEAESHTGHSQSWHDFVLHGLTTR